RRLELIGEEITIHESMRPRRRRAHHLHQSLEGVEQDRSIHISVAWRVRVGPLNQVIGSRRAEPAADRLELAGIHHVAPLAAAEPLFHPYPQCHCWISVFLLLQDNRSYGHLLSAHENLIGKVVSIAPVLCICVSGLFLQLMKLTEM